MNRGRSVGVGITLFARRAGPSPGCSQHNEQEPELGTGQVPRMTEEENREIGEAGSWYLQIQTEMMGMSAAVSSDIPEVFQVAQTESDASPRKATGRF